MEQNALKSFSVTLTNTKGFVMKAVKSIATDHSLVFPCLMEAEDGEVVLFVKPKCGTPITNHVCRIGEYDTEWYMPIFKPYNGTITLAND